MRVYLDHNASAPLRPEARSAMAAALDLVGNPSSAHREGAAVRTAVEGARAEVAGLVGAAPREIVFTSGATEANNLAIRGVTAAERGRIVTSAIEHASVLETARAIGTRVDAVAVDADGRIAVDDVVAACAPAGRASSPAGSGGPVTDDRPALLTLGLANGEVGTVVPVAAVARALAGSHVVVHTDAAQAAGRIPVDVRGLGVDLLSLSAHKLGGPAGVGALWVRAGVSLVPSATGGPQERDRRAGTENVVGIVGFGAAARAARLELDAVAARTAELRDRLWARIRAALPDAVVNGPADGPRLPNTLNVGFPGVAGESLLVLLDLDGVAASLGSACAAGAPEPSHVLRAMGRSDAEARSGLRLSLGPGTTADEVDRVAAILPRLVAQIRAGRAA